MSSSPTAELVEPEIAKESEAIGTAVESAEAEAAVEAVDSSPSPARKTEAVEVGGGLLALVENLC